MQSPGLHYKGTVCKPLNNTLHIPCQCIVKVYRHAKGFLRGALAKSQQCNAPCKQPV